MKVAIAGDHAGYELRRSLTAELVRAGYEMDDLGAQDPSPSDYPDHARVVGKAVTTGRAERGIVICGSGIGACVAANKIRGIRAGVAHDTYSAHQGVEHDDMNVLCLGARVIGRALALELALAFLQARYAGEERFRRRVEKVLDMERRGE